MRDVWMPQIFSAQPEGDWVSRKLGTLSLWAYNSITEKPMAAWVRMEAAFLEFLLW